jgi:hypothetical protein
MLCSNVINILKNLTFLDQVHRQIGREAGCFHIQVRKFSFAHFCECYTGNCVQNFHKKNSAEKRKKFFVLKGFQKKVKNSHQTRIK